MEKNTLFLNSKTRWLKTRTLMLLLFSIFLWLPNSILAQPLFESLPPTGSNNSFPLNSTSSNRVQWLYLPSEFTPTLPTGNYLITKIYLMTTSTSASTFTDLSVSIGTTTQTATTATWVSGLQQCYFATSATFPAPVGGWMEIDLQTPYIWDTSQNLII